MTFVDEKGAPSAAVMRWIISILCAVAFGLAGIIWANLTSQISELRADARITQNQVNEMRLSVQELKGRIANLVDTLNERTAQQERVPRGR
jgi:exosome complex RNA-binding protein Rrp4